jgi:hypothetical protein
MVNRRPPIFSRPVRRRVDLASARDVSPGRHYGTLGLDLPPAEVATACRVAAAVLGLTLTATGESVFVFVQPAYWPLQWVQLIVRVRDDGDRTRVWAYGKQPFAERYEATAKYTMAVVSVYLSAVAAAAGAGSPASATASARDLTRKRRWVRALFISQWTVIAAVLVGLTVLVSHAFFLPLVWAWATAGVAGSLVEMARGRMFGVTWEGTMRVVRWYLAFGAVSVVAGAVLLVYQV